MRVLVVDDMGAMRMQVKKTLESLGFQDVETANHGKAAFDRLIAVHDIPEKRFDLCLSDWNMQPIDGLSLLKMVRNNKNLANMTFILLTAEQGRDNVVAALQAGVDEYIVKPFTRDTVKGKLENVARRKIADIEQQFQKITHGADSEKFLETLEDEKSGKLLNLFRNKITEVMALSPLSHLGPMALGKLYLHFKKNDEAEKQFRACLSIDFGIAEAHAMLSKALQAQGKLSESSKQLEIALAVQPDSAEIRQKLGAAYMKEGNYAKAITILNESLRALESKGDPAAMAKSLSALGGAKMGHGEASKDSEMLKEAAKDLQKAVKIYPELVSAQYNLMMAYRQTGQTDKALEVLDAIQKTEPADVEGWFALGKVFLEQNEPAKAVFAFAKAEGLAVAKAELCFDIATALYQNKLFKQSLDYVGKGQESNPSDLRFYNLEGLISRATENYKQAITAYDKAIKLSPEDAALYFNIGVAYLKTEESDKAVGAFEKAVSLNPGIKALVDKALAK
jgi:two-component system chemotaxis response regulator CheY